MIIWTQQDQTAAYAEGWGVFDNSDHGLEIERLDDPTSVDPSWPEQPKFAGDDEALAHVKTNASKGEPLARKALAYLAQETGHG